MLIIGCDYHPGFQQIAFVDTETGEFGERRLTHREEAEEFYGRSKSGTCVWEWKPVDTHFGLSASQNTLVLALDLASTRPFRAIV